MNDVVSMPTALVEAMRPAMAALGMDPLRDRIVPKISIDEPIRECALKLGQLLRNCGLYRVGSSRKLKALNQEEEWENMTAERFCGWVEGHIQIVKAYKGRGDAYIECPVSMGKNFASLVLAQDVFLAELPIIDQFASVRVPVMRADGKYELLKKGYDAEARVWCADSIEYDLDVKNPDAMKIFEEVCKEFPFAEMEEGNMWKNRSFLVHLTAMMGVYCRLMFPLGTLRPMIGYFANEQGSGKSLLTVMALSPVFGMPTAADLPIQNGKVDTAKFTVLLETIAQTRSPYLWLDDVPGSVVANTLNKFITSPRHTGRKFKTNDELFDEPNVTQIFITGNNVHVKKDVQQRAMLCELFSSVSSETRTPSMEMDAVWLSRVDVRARLLSALHCFFRDWADGGALDGMHVKRRTAGWSKVIGGILADAGVSEDPFVTPELPMSGDTEGDEIRTLLCALADDAEDQYEMAENEALERDDSFVWRGYQVTTQDLITKARDMGLLIGLVGLPEDKGLKKGELIALGRKLEGWRGKEDMASTKGRRFRFGHRRQKSGTVYPLEWL